MRRALFAAGLLLAGSADAADRAGVTVPDVVTVNGHTLHLNGIALRTATIMHLRVYVAALYVEQPTRDPAVIIAPRGQKLLLFRFLRSVDRDDVRDSWRDGFEDNCATPCPVPSATRERFLNSVLAVHEGDESRMSFDGAAMAATLNGRPIGGFENAALSELLVKSFLGPKPPTETLKQELLGAR